MLKVVCGSWKLHRNKAETQPWNIQGLWKPSGQGSSRQDQLLTVAVPAKVMLLSFSKEIAPRPPTSVAPWGQRTALVRTGWADWSSSSAVWLWWAVIESWEKRPSEHQESAITVCILIRESYYHLSTANQQTCEGEGAQLPLFSPGTLGSGEGFFLQGTWEYHCLSAIMDLQPTFWWAGACVTHLQPLLWKKNRDWVPLLTAGLVVLLVEGAEKYKWIGFQFLSAHCHLPPQICALIFMDTFNPFGPRMFQSQYKLFVGFVGNLVISTCWCSLSVSLENFYSGSWFCWHLIFLSMNYIGTWQIIFSPFAFVAREPRANHLILTV